MRYVFALLACLFASPSAAQVATTGAGKGAPTAPVTYTGPGDIVSGATAWYGLRAYNAAYATGSNKSINVRRASDNTTQDILILSNGKLDVASANSFAGTDATCTGTISSTTLTCASASSTPHAGSTLTGTGITQPSYIVSCGTFTGGAGTCTLNASQTVSVGETITMQYGLYVTKAYDQGGGAHDVSQATAAKQPQLLPLCVSSLPCMNYVAASSSGLQGTITTVSQPNSYSFVWEMTTDNQSGGTQSIISTFTSGSQQQVYYDAHPYIIVYAGSFAQSGTNLSLATFYAAQVLVSGSSSKIEYNGTLVSSLAAGAGGTSTSIGLGIRPGGTQPGDQEICEGGLWPSDTSASWATLNSNQRTYWGI